MSKTTIYRYILLKENLKRNGVSIKIFIPRRSYDQIENVLNKLELLNDNAYIEYFLIFVILLIHLLYVIIKII